MLIHRNLPDVMFRFHPDGAQGGDAGAGGQHQGGSAAAPATQAQGNQAAAASQGQSQGQSNGSEVPQGLASMIAKNNNDALKVAELLHGDNFQLREKNRQLQATIDGAVVLRDADKSSWEQYRALGAPGDIATKLRGAEVERIASKAGYDADVFADLDRMAGGKLQYEVKSETVDGKAVERVYVKDTADANAQPQLLNDFVTAKYAKYLPSLQPTAQSQGQGQAGGQNGSATSQGTRFPAQGTGNSGAQGSVDMVDQYVNKVNEQGKAATNPLVKK